MGLSISISNSILSESMIEGLSPVNIVPPVVSGVGIVGQTLSSTTGTWSGSVPISYSYQWKRNGSPILGANSSSYLLVTADGDTDVTCTVTATNTKGVSSSVSNSIAVIGYDPNAYAFFQATGITDPIIKDAVDILVKDLKLYNIWSKMKAIYPFVGGTATTHKFNLKDPQDTNAAFRLAFSGGITHNANGMQGNGVNGFANTFLIPASNLIQDSTHMSFYSRSNIIDAQIDMGTTIIADSRRLSMQLSYSGNFAADHYNFSTGRITTANSNTSGYFLSSRINSTTHKAFKNSTQLGTTNTGASGLVSALTSPMYVAAANQGGTAVAYSSKQCCFATIGDGLTDEDSANLYYSVQKFQTTLGRQVGTPIYSSNATDVNARLFLGATNIQDATITSAVDTLVQGLKTDGIWTKLKAVYPFVGGTATTHKFNLANALDEDTAFRLQFNGGLTHSSNGVLGNNFNGYADTFISPSARLNLNDTSVSIYSRTDATNNKGDFGVTVSSFYLGYLKFTDGKQYYLVNSSTPYGITSTTNTSLGLFTFNRKSSTTQNLYKNGTEIHTMTKNSVALPTSNMYLLGVNSGEFSNKQFAFASIGDGLTPTEAANLYTRVQAFQTTLNRQV